MASSELRSVLVLHEDAVELFGTPSHAAAIVLSSSGAPSTMRNSGRRRPRF
jgi:hypothetical protein